MLCCRGLELFSRWVPLNKQAGVLRMGLRARKVFGSFEKRAPDHNQLLCLLPVGNLNLLSLFQ